MSPQLDLRVSSILLLLFTILILTTKVVVAQQPILQHSILQLKQSLIRQSAYPNSPQTLTIISALNHLAVFSFSPKLVLKSPQDLTGKRIVITNPISRTRDIYDEDSELLVRQLSTTEMAFKSQLEMVNKMNNQSSLPIIVPHSITKYDEIYFDCVFGNPLNNFDVFVMSSQDFIRSFVPNVPMETSVAGLHEWNEFSFLREFQVPIEVSVYYNESSKLNESVTENFLTKLYNGFDSQYFNNGSIPSFEALRNFGYMFYTNGYGNISNYEREYLNYYLTQFNDIPLKQRPTVQYYPFSSHNYSIEYEKLSLKHYNQSTSILSFNQMFCYEKFNDMFVACSNEMGRKSNIGYDVINLLTIVLGLVYYVALLTVFKTKSIKRKLTAPYILPILVIGANICFSYYSNSCKSIRSAAIVCLIAGVVGVYGFTLVRFTYLRYLYYFLSKTQGEVFVKMHKIFVSTTFGIVGSVLSGLVYAIIWMIVCVPYINLESFSRDSQLVLNIMYVVEVLTGTLLGSIVILIDVAFNWKKIKDKGLYNFLTFEDPFGLRLDLITFGCIFICTTSIVIITPFPFEYNTIAIGMFKAGAFIFTYLLGGGTAILLEWKRMIFSYFSKKFTKSETNEDDESVRFEELMKDDLFKELFHSYSSKELSLENSYLYEELQKLKVIHQQDDSLDFDTYKRLFETYFQSLSKYEVNLPSPAKKQLISIYEKQQPTNFSKVFEIVRTELLLNLNDTFDRLKDTSEFKRYSFSRDIQLKNSIV